MTSIDMKLLKAVVLATGDLAERLAIDCDNYRLDHSKWYRAVKRVRKLLKEQATTELRAAGIITKKGKLKKKFRSETSFPTFKYT